MPRKTFRAWVNQPSTLQPLHALHGKRCIAVDEGGTTIRIWFTEGETISMEAPRNSISEGN